MLKAHRGILNPAPYKDFMPRRIDDINKRFIRIKKSIAQGKLKPLTFRELKIGIYRLQNTAALMHVPPNFYWEHLNPRI